jgi:Protein of unknown function (DUF1573)
MRYLTLLLVLWMAFTACGKSNKNRAPNAKDPKSIQKSLTDTAYFSNILWQDSIVNFGTINFGEKVEIKYRFKNVGEFPLILTNVVPGCGCTVTTYTSAPIAPNEEGLITATFDSNRSHGGVIRKSIYCQTNTKGNTKHELIFQGEVRDCNSCDY